MFNIQIKPNDSEINGSKVIVEAGHIYTDEEPTLEQMVGAAIGKNIIDLLKIVGATPEGWLFVDDYNPQFKDLTGPKPGKKLDIIDYTAQLREVGFAPVKVIYESSLVTKAEKLLGMLDGGNKTKCVNGITMLKKDNVLLYNQKSEKYMCALLDACLYIEKLEQAPFCITILDQQYAPQQKGTLTILKKLGVDTTCIFPFFYTTPGNPTDHQSITPSNVFAYGSIHNNKIQPNDTINMLLGLLKITSQIGKETIITGGAVTPYGL